MLQCVRLLNSVTLFNRNKRSHDYFSTLVFSFIVFGFLACRFTVWVHSHCLHQHHFEPRQAAVFSPKYKNLLSNQSDSEMTDTVSDWLLDKVWYLAAKESDIYLNSWCTQKQS